MMMYQLALKAYQIISLHIACTVLHVLCAVYITFMHYEEYLNCKAPTSAVSSGFCR